METVIAFVLGAVIGAIPFARRASAARTRLDAALAALRAARSELARLGNARASTRVRQ